jgi:RNA-directed DNA polymerase
MSSMGGKKASGKGARWVKDRPEAPETAATEEKEDGTKRELTLLLESDTPIRRHVKIKADARVSALG